jgi:hypothetical protein
MQAKHQDMLPTPLVPDLVVPEKAVVVQVLGEPWHNSLPQEHLSFVSLTRCPESFQELSRSE